MPQSEMEALLQLQKETIESLRQLVESQRHTIEQMSKSHEAQTAQLNQTIANLNETVEYLKKKLFASSSEKSNKDVHGKEKVHLLHIRIYLVSFFRTVPFKAGFPPY